jgi:hypothetical protein
LPQKDKKSQQRKIIVLQPQLFRHPTDPWSRVYELLSRFITVDVDPTRQLGMFRAAPGHTRLV